MPFDPTKPVNNTTADADEVRNNFIALKDLIPTVYQNENVKLNAKMWTGQAATQGGAASFNPTDDNTHTGNALFAHIYAVHLSTETYGYPNIQSTLCVGFSGGNMLQQIDCNVLKLVPAGPYQYTFQPADDGTVVHCTIIGD